MAHDQAHAAPPPPQVMFKLITGYWVSQAVGTAADLGVADGLADGPRSAAELAAEVGADPGALFRLLRTCASVGVFHQDEAGRFSLTPVGETLRANVPGSMRDMAIAQTAPGHWLPWGRLREATRTGTRQTPAALGCEIFEHYRKNPGEAAAFSGAMNNLAGLVASEVARVLDVSGASHAVDVGGANGTLLAALLRANPALSGVLVDLPHVVPGAKAALDALGLGGRCEAIAGDFFKAVPAADLYLLKNILHDWDDAQATTILRNCAKAMSARGKLLIIEMIIPDDGRPSPAQLMDLNMLVMLSGRERTAKEYRALLEAAGLKLDRVVETHSPFQIVEASAA